MTMKKKLENAREASALDERQRDALEAQLDELREAAQAVVLAFPAGGPDLGIAVSKLRRLLPPPTNKGGNKND